MSPTPPRRSRPAAAVEGPPRPTEGRVWPTERLAALDYPTPVFVYDGAEVRRRVDLVRRAFGSEIRLLYAVKANPLPALLGTMATVVDGLDVASEGEMNAADAAGFAPDRLRLAGPGKTAALLERAVRSGVPVSVETPGELTDVAGYARALGRRAQVLLRLEPREPRRAFGVQMSGPTHPFGLDAEETVAALDILRAAPDAIDLLGVHVYSGTQCRSIRGWMGHLAEALDLAEAVRRAGFALREINVGGGFGVAHSGTEALDVAALGPRARRTLDRFAAAAAEAARPRFVLELGRYLVADAGVYLTTVLRTKTRGAHHIAVLDGGAHHLWAATGQLGPSPPPVAVSPPGRGSLAPGRTHLMGPLCTPLDHLGAIAGRLRQGDRVAFIQAGAYGATLSPLRFLGHPAPREVLLDRDPAPIEPAARR